MFFLNNLSKKYAKYALFSHISAGIGRMVTRRKNF